MLERTLLAGTVMGLVGFFFFKSLIAQGWEPSQARDHLLLLMVFFQIVHIGNCRSESLSAFVLSPLRNPILLGGSCLALLAHFLAMATPLGQSVLEVAPVTLAEGARLIAVSLTVLAVMELHKLWLRWRQS